MMRYKDPRELEVRYVLPAIRKELAVALAKKGCSQSNIAKMLGLTTPAVSNYVGKKRGLGVHFEKEMLKEIKLAANRLEKGSSLLEETQNILHSFRKKRLVCILCREHLGVDEKCAACL